MNINNFLRNRESVREFRNRSVNREKLDDIKSMIKDLIVDEIYTKVIAFMPQLVMKRSDITVTTDGVNVFVKINCCICG